ncbi:hypothetical protein Sango_2819700 [Sesamum angolense]|uniref:RNase H type-1 domain-containing protein n=1 Tax=Sesamum angolense TaxID=2727404 RepID=A0AAE1T8F2_9LAMI|nr:hypothetical protein Sango_2819700 [Sesamum angolense]
MKEVLDAEAMEDTPLIRFGRAEWSGHKNAHTDALVITALLANYEVGRIFIVSGSSTDILFGEAYDQMQLGETLIEKVNTSLYGFARSSKSMRHDLTSINSRDRIHSKDISSKILGGHTLRLQCALGETHSQCFPGIEANPLKIKDILDVKVPTNVNEVQRLIGRIAALSCFISKVVEKSLPFFKGEHEHAIEANFGKVGYFRSIGEIGCGIKRVRHLIPTTHKAQSLANFVSKMAGAPMENASKMEKWLLHVDGSSTTQDSGAGVVTTSPHGEDLEFAVKFGLKASNNEAEYEAFVISMRVAHKVGAKHLVAYFAHNKRVNT